jgi:hypothetical protein
VERVADAAVRVDGVAQLLGEQHRRHARDVRLPGQHLQIDHQLDVLFDVRRGAGRGGRHRQIVRQLLAGLLDAPLDLAYVGQVLIEPCPIGDRQRALQRRGLAEH